MSAPRVEPPASSRLARARAVLRDAGALAPLAVALVAAPTAGAVVLAATTEQWLPVFRPGGVVAVVAFLALTIPLCGLSLVPTHAAAGVAGFAFGRVLGPMTALAGISGAAALGFVVLRRAAGDRLTRVTAARPRVRAVHRALLAQSPGRTATLVLLLRLAPALPFAGTNLLVAAAGVPLRTFLVGSVLGLAPRVAGVAFAGAMVGELDLAAVHAEPWWIAVGLAATVVLLFVIGRVGRRALDRVLEGGGGAGAAPQRSS